MLALTVIAQSLGAYTVQLRTYRERSASPMQVAAFEARNDRQMLDSLRGSVRESADVRVRPEQARQFGSGSISGHVVLRIDDGEMLVTLDAAPFYRGTTLRIRPCFEHKLSAAKVSYQDQTQIVAKTLRVDNGNC